MDKEQSYAGSIEMTRSDVLLHLIEKHNFSNMIEIGVGSGMVSHRIVTEVKNHKFLLIGIDPYEVYDEYNSDINASERRVKSNRSCMLGLMTEFMNSGRFRMLYDTSAEAYSSYPMTIKENNIHLIFVDGNHAYRYIKKDITLYWRVLIDGGIMVFHDYDRESMFPGVKQAVDEFSVSRKIPLRFLGDCVYVIKK